jgi:hypothetical protein
MARPLKPPVLTPRNPQTVLAWSMQKLRKTNGWTGKQVAATYGCSPSHISRVEHGAAMPSRPLVQFYDDAFDGDGMLHSIYEAALYADEQGRRREGGKRAPLYTGQPGDASTFEGDTIPHGSLMQPGQAFEKVWTIRNSGTISWIGRRLERQGPLTGPGLITSPKYVDIPDSEPGNAVQISAQLKAPTYDCTSIAYFKMIDTEGRLCFPSKYQLGVDVLVRVAGQKPAKEEDHVTDTDQPDGEPPHLLSAMPSTKGLDRREVRMQSRSPPSVIRSWTDVSAR